MDRFDAMATLIAVLDEGSLTAAGRRLGIPLPTVSRRIADLERQIGTRLLARSTRRLVATEAGAAYATACRRILEDLREAERAASGEQIEPRGVLGVAAPLVFGRLHVLPLVAEFIANYPAIDVRLSLSDRNIDLLEEGIDAALRIGRLPDSATIATQVGTLRWVVCASPDVLATFGTPLAPADLAAMPCVTFAAAAWRFRRGRRGRAITVPVRTRLSVDTAEAARDAAVAGIGVTRLLSYQVEDAVRAGRLDVVLEGYEPAAIPVHVLHHAVERPALKLRCFLDFAVPRLRRRLAGQ